MHFRLSASVFSPRDDYFWYRILNLLVLCVPYLLIAGTGDLATSPLPFPPRVRVDGVLPLLGLPLPASFSVS